jgi:hypothetical protein
MRLDSRFHKFGRVLRAFCAYVVVFCFQVSLQSLSATSLSTTEKGHEESCGCGPKCRKDRCCCKPDSVEKSFQLANQAELEEHGSDTLWIKPACLMSGPCGEMPDAPESPRNRTYSPKLVTLINFAQQLPEIGYFHFNDFDNAYFLYTVSDLERPPRA